MLCAGFCLWRKAGADSSLVLLIAELSENYLIVDLVAHKGKIQLEDAAYKQLIQII